MATPTVLVATWDDGLIAIADGESLPELQGQPVRGLTSDGEGGTTAMALEVNGLVARMHRYQPFDASGWPLEPSGLLGPIRLVPLRRGNH